MNKQNTNAVSAAIAQTVIIYRQYHKNGHIQTVLSGSGVIYDAQGIIVTNEHILNGESGFVVETASGRRYPATIVGRSEVSDIAVLRIVPDEALTEVTLGANTPPAGTHVFAVGAPFSPDFKNTATFGRISHPRRFDPMSHIPSMPVLQADIRTAICNSGGGLFSENGLLVGLNTLYFDTSGASHSGYNFSVRAADILWVVNQILTRGTGPSQYTLGVDINPVCPAIAKVYGLERPVGVMIEDVAENSLAAACGLAVGDILRRVGDIADISCPNALDYALMRSEGQTVGMEVVRAGVPLALSLCVPQNPPQKSTSKKRLRGYNSFGLHLRRRDRGVGIDIASVKPGSEAAIEGFVGDREVILALQNPETGDWVPIKNLTAYRHFAKDRQGQYVAARIATPDGHNIKGLKL